MRVTAFPDKYRSIKLLADVPEFVEPVGLMRWREWAQPPARTDPQWWIDATRREAGRSTLPITLVAADSEGTAAGAIGIKQFDLPQLHDRSPWIIGMIIRSDLRGQGIGSALVEGIEAIAATHGYSQLWVATEQAARFYQRCGYTLTETLDYSPESKHILTRELLTSSTHR